MTEFSKTDEKYQNTGFRIFYKQIRIKTKARMPHQVTGHRKRREDYKAPMKKRAEYSQRNSK